MHKTNNGHRNVVTNFTKVAINGQPSIGGYPCMEGAIEQLDPFHARPLLHIEPAYVQRYISGAL